MRIKNKLLAIALTMVLTMGMAGADVSAASYALHYTAGAPSTQNVTSANISVTASGKDRITVNSSVFSTYISGAYCQAKCTNYASTAANITSTGSYSVVFSGSTIPKKGVSLVVQTKLVQYNESRSVAANGTINP